MAVTTQNKEELAEAIKSGADTIIVEADMKNNVYKIMCVGKIAWAVVALALAAIVVTAIVPNPATGTASTAGLMAAAIPTLGTGGTVFAVGLAAAGGGVAVLNKLRKYKTKELEDGRLLLTKK